MIFTHSDCAWDSIDDKFAHALSHQKNDMNSTIYDNDYDQTSFTALLSLLFPQRIKCSIINVKVNNHFQSAVKTEEVDESDRCEAFVGNVFMDEELQRRIIRMSCCGWETTAKCGCLNEMRDSSLKKALSLSIAVMGLSTFIFFGHHCRCFL